MDKRTYFLAALKANAHLRKDWIISMFSVIKLKQSNPTDRYPYQLIGMNRGINGTWIFNNPDPNATTVDDTVIDGSKSTEPLFAFREPLTLKPGDLPNVTKEIKTTYGNALFNAIALVWPFGNKIDYQEGQIKGKTIDSLVASKLVDYPEPGKERDPKAIYVDEYLKYVEAMSSLAGLTSLCAPAASPKTMTIDPAIIKRRDELFEQYKDQLNDKAIVAKIEGELMEMDKASLKGDPSEEFFITDMATVGRKRMHIAFGAEVGFSGASKPVTIKKSLREGWDVNNMPTMVDVSRSGSYNRGAETALGGESVKYFYRIFQNTRVAEEDCGAKNGLRWDVTDENYKQFLGLYMIQGTKAIEITDTLLKTLIGKTIYVRTPLLCKTAAPSFCAVCVGKALAANPTGLHIAASNVGSRFMGASMKAMHAQALSVKRYEFKKAIS